MNSDIYRELFIQGLDLTHTYYPLFDRSYVRELIDGGVTAINETVAPENSSFEGIIKRIYDLRNICNKIEEVLLVSNTSDIKKANQQRKLAVIFGLQNLPFSISTYPDELSFIDMLYRMGIKICQLTYQRRNLLGNGCGERSDGGLSKFGIQVIEEMNRHGMLIDLSHVGPKSTMEAIEISKDPVVFTHSNCISICDNVRNKNDEQIKALAEKDGVIGICAFEPLVRMDRPPVIKDFLDHTDHAIEIVGINHVGIGLDYAKTPFIPNIDSIMQKPKINYPELFTSWMVAKQGKGWYILKDLDKPSKWKHNITRGLLNRGYSISEIEKILGKNFMRVFEKVWRS